MRRTDREIKDKSIIVQVMKSCHCCRLGLIDDGRVYIVPLNFGEIIDEQNITLYFHCAKEGRKIELIRKNSNIGFEMDVNYKLKEAEVACNYSAFYQSIIGEGIIEIVEDYDEKIKGLNAIMSHVTGKVGYYNDTMIKTVCVLKLTVTKLSGKQHTM